jgi:alkanesulfonate monooxygenase SsuD/methylene tetrahydromethanopterin reductase-like flavin-dependent oxidoreductase (luciferase family)
MQVRSIGNAHVAMARRENLTIRQLYERQASGWGLRVLVGSPEQIADDMQEWFENGAADGFNICPPYLPDTVQNLGVVMPLSETDAEPIVLRRHDRDRIRR